MKNNITVKASPFVMSYPILVLIFWVRSLSEDSKVDEHFSGVSYIDNLQLPQVFDTLQCAVSICEEIGQIFMETQSIQPGSKRGAAITAQRFHL